MFNCIFNVAQIWHTPLSAVGNTQYQFITSSRRLFMFTLTQPSARERQRAVSPLLPSQCPAWATPSVFADSWAVY